MMTHQIYIRELLELISKQVSTSLPGIVSMVMQKTFDLIAGLCRQPVLNVKTLWVDLNEQILTEILRRKHKMKISDGLIASAHVNTFPSILRDLYEIGDNSTRNVDNHLFYYGKRNDSLFELKFGVVPFGKRYFDEEKQQFLIEPDISLVRDDKKYEHLCYFPELSDDLFSNLIALNTWKKMVTTNPLKRFTLAFEVIFETSSQFK